MAVTVRSMENVPVQPWKIQEMICIIVYIYIYKCIIDMLLLCFEKDALYFKRRLKLASYLNTKMVKR